MMHFSDHQFVRKQHFLRFLAKVQCSRALLISLILACKNSLSSLIQLLKMLRSDYFKPNFNRCAFIMGNLLYKND